MTVLAIDSGQTVIKVALAGKTFSFPGVRTNTGLLPQLAEVVAHVAAGAGAGPFEVAIGTTGLTAVDDDPDELLRLCLPGGVTRVLLAHDSVTSFLGALGDQRGVVCAAGTGVITFGVGAHDVARVDGWGNIIGDAGSSYWIGREALDAVLRAHDGRGPWTRLTEVVRRRFPELENAYIELQTDPDLVRVVASFARVVGELAPADGVAAAICERAAGELAHSVATAVRRIGQDDLENPLVCLIGGGFASEPVLSACIAALRRRWPGFTPCPARGDGLDGARRLPAITPDHPLADRISRSRSTATR